MVRINTAVICLSIALSCASTAHAVVTSDWATVGNASNAPDTRYDPNGYGGVDDIYRISKHEVTAGQYAEFLNAVAGIDTYGLYKTYMWSSSFGCKIARYAGSGTAGDPYQYQVAADREDRPVNCVSWGDAARFTNWLHNGQPTGSQDLTTTEDGAYFLNGATTNADLLAVSRELDATYFIPSEDEWYKAAYHKNDGVTGNYFDYPTSSDTAPGFVNDSGNLSGTGNPFVEGGTDPGNYATYDREGGTNGIGSPYYMTQVGEWENSESPYGTFDQGGNVWEWNEAVISSSYRGLRGGSFYGSDINLHADYRVSLNPSIEYDNVGFRVATVPEPSTVLLGALAAVGLLMRRRV